MRARWEREREGDEGAKEENPGWIFPSVLPKSKRQRLTSQPPGQDMQERSAMMPKTPKTLTR